MQTIQSELEVRIRSDNKRTLLLHGYGVSIRIKDKKLVIKNGEHPLYPESKFEKVVLTDHADFDRIIIQGTYGWISFPALKWLASWNINVIMLDDLGRLYCNINQVEGQSYPLIRQMQYDCFRNKQKVLQLQKWIVSHKITAQIMLMRELDFDTEYMEKQFALLPKVNTVRKISAIESHVSTEYYSNLATYFDRINPELGFKSRVNPMTFRKNDASDVINALLNYGFAILKTEIAKQLNANGLDCYVGFMHHNHAGYTSLVYDMVEPFRHLVDKSVIAIANDINPKEDYYYQIGNLGYPFKSGTPFMHRWLMLTSQLKKRYVAYLTTILQKKRYVKSDKVGIKTEHGFQKVEEVTIMKMKCVELRDYILERRKTLSDAPKILSR